MLQSRYERFKYKRSSSSQVGIYKAQSIILISYVCNVNSTDMVCREEERIGNPQNIHWNRLTMEKDEGITEKEELKKENKISEKG